MKVKVKCKCCGGTGRVELTGRYAETLKKLRGCGEITGAELARRDGCNATAMNNRLAALERHGLARSRRFGRQRLYQACEPHPPLPSVSEYLKAKRGKK